MATDLKGLTIASTYQDLVKRDSGTYSQTGMNIEIQNDSGTALATGLYLESGATTSNVGIGTASPDTTLHVKSATSLEPVLILENTNADQHNSQIHFLKSDETSLADADNIGQIDFRAMNDASGTKEEIVFGRIQGVRDDFTDATEDGSLHFSTVVNTTLTENLTIKGGYVGIGVTAPTAELNVESPGAPSIQITRHLDGDFDANGWTVGHLTFGGQDDDSGVDNDAAFIKGFIPTTANGGGAWTSISHPCELSFFTTPATTTGAVQRLTISAAGNVGIGNTNPTSPLHVLRNLASSDTSTPVAVIHQTHTGDDQYALHVVQDGVNLYTQVIESTNAEPQGLLIFHSGKDSASDDSADDEFFACRDNDTNHFEIYGDGDWNTLGGSEQASDRRIKKNIVDATSKLAELNQIKVRNFNFCDNDGSDLTNTKMGKKRIGFIAQELEEVFPSAIHEKKHRWMGKDYDDFKRISTGALVPILVKAIQELSAKVIALENA